MRNVQHAIDVVPGSKLPNLPDYCINLTERAELERQVKVIAPHLLAHTKGWKLVNVC